MNRKNVSPLLKRAENHRAFITVSILLAIFFLFEARLLLKMDDGNFLGMLTSPDFTYSSFLKNRYETLSGRTIGEFLLMFFLGKPLILWKIVSLCLLLYIIAFLCRLCRSFHGDLPWEKQEAFCCSGIFLIFISVVNASVFWFAGSFTYLWPAAGMLMTVAPLAFYCLDGKYSAYHSAIACITAVLASAQEQSAAATLALLVILMILCRIKKRKIKFHMILPLPITVVLTVYLLASPGSHVRGISTAKTFFPRFLEMSAFEKLSCGFTNYLSHTFSGSVFLFLMFMALMSICLYNAYGKSKKARGALIALNVYVIIAVAVGNLLYFIFEKTDPYLGMQKVFQKGVVSPAAIITAIIFTVVFLAVVVAVVALMIKKTEIGICVALLCAASFGCAMALSFSGSIYLSGQRVFFYSDLFLLAACCAIVGTLPNDKVSSHLLIGAEIYAAVFFIIDCISFSLMELPIMA